MLILLYTGLTYLLLPFFFIRLFLKKKEHPGYAKHWKQRLGYAPSLPPGGLWIHAASVGDVNIVLTLLPKLTHWPHILVTTHTPAGRDQLLSKHALHSYIPADCSALIRRFLKRTKVTQLVLVESEIWPNLINECSKKGLPVSVINGRISARSFKKFNYVTIKPLAKHTLAQLTQVLPQSLQDSARFHKLGVRKNNLKYYGNIKYDTHPPETCIAQGKALRQRWGASRIVLLAASTHPGEDEIILEAFDKVKAKHSEALLVIALRHPHRSNDVLALIQNSAHKVACHSQGHWDQTIDILIVDTLGELWQFYAACDIAIVCGTFMPIGGHNPIEPARLRKPILTGPYLFNATDIYRRLRHAGGHATYRNAHDLGQACLKLYEDDIFRKEMGNKAYQTVIAQQGCIARTVTALETIAI